MILWKHLFKQLNKPTSYVMQFYHTTFSITSKIEAYLEKTRS